MARQPLIGSLRIRRASTLSVSEQGQGGTPPSDPYFARLVKMVPAEVLAFYVAFKTVVAAFPGTWAFVCLLLVVLVRTLGTKESGKAIQWIAVVVASVSFVLWVYATGGHFFMWELPASPADVARNAQGIVSAAIGVWTFVVPYFYKGE